MCLQNQIKNRRANRSSETAEAGDSVMNKQEQSGKALEWR